MGSGTGIRRAPETVGRAGELVRLDAAVRRAATGDAVCVVVAGEGGVGKTRLLAEAAHLGRAHGLAVLSGRAPISAPVAFSVVAEALRSWLRDNPLPVAPSPYDRGVCLVLPEWPSEHSSELSASQVRLLALEGVVHVLRRVVAVTGGAVVLLDDLHAADAESLEAVRYLAAAGIGGVALVAALRPGEADVADELVRGLRGGAAEILSLSALDAAGVRALVAGLLATSPPDALVADIVARTDGLPLYVEEVLDAHLTSGSLRLTDGRPVWAGGAVVPRTVLQMVGARLDRIGRPHRDVVAAGAVTGDFDPDLLASVAATDPAVVHDALLDGVRVGLLEAASGTIAFRHALVRDAVLETVLPHLLRLMHRRAMVWLSPDPFGPREDRTIERRARHALALGEDDLAASLLAQAAQARLAEHALLDAERLAREAVGRARADSDYGPSCSNRGWFGWEVTV